MRNILALVALVLVASACSDPNPITDADAGNSMMGDTGITPTDAVVNPTDVQTMPEDTPVTPPDTTVEDLVSVKKDWFMNVAASKDVSR